MQYTDVDKDLRQCILTKAHLKIQQDIKYKLTYPGRWDAQNLDDLRILEIACVDLLKMEGVYTDTRYAELTGDYNE